MKNIILITSLILFFAINVRADSFDLDMTALKGQAQFIPHSGEGKWDNYLIRNLPFKPVQKLHHELQSAVGKDLISRGEAHITVVTPVEFWNDLRPAGVTMREIDEIAKKNGVQEAGFTPLCVGRGRAILGEKVEDTYYVVVSSKKLLDIRKEVAKLYWKKGGDPEAGFAWHNWYPHITIGFTKRDLHESDRVVKDEKSCVFDLKI